MKKEKQNQLEDENIAAEDLKTEKKEKASKITKIGAMLKEMRQQKGLKISDVARKLCIRKCYLESIEESNYNDIPAFPYGNGFIRSYANFLGLNGDNIVELYKEETTSFKQKDMNVFEPQPEATMPNIQHLVISLLAIALIYAGWVFYNQQHEQNEESNIVFTEDDNAISYENVVVIEDVKISQTAETNKSGVLIDTQNEEQIIVSNDEYKEEMKTSSANEEVINDISDESAKPVKVEIPNVGVYIEVLKTTWVEVKDNETLYLSKVLQPGELYRVPSGEGKILSVGKYDGVNVYINGVLSNVVRPQKKMNIYLDNYINPEM
ncbi:MAG: helix-turn-helix domain-containing protein [Alphaproteobacteria bacterium]|nr:helix-turn-helix domain-containing protein [Alphaproteobacteria bacterium]